MARPCYDDVNSVNVIEKDTPSEAMAIFMEKIFRKRGDGMKDICYINDLERLKALADPLRVSLLTALGTTKKNSQQLAKALKINRTKIHYHLNILEELGFIEVVDTDLINGIVQKYYLPTARAFVPAANIFNEIFHTDSIEFSVKKTEEKNFLKEFGKLKEKYATEKKDTDSVNFGLIKL